MSILPNKFFKVLLPVATATTATIFTVYLVAAFTKELNKKKEEDPVLDNIELKAEKFEEELIQGSEDFEKETKQGEDSEENKDSGDSKKEEATKPEEEVTDIKKAQELMENAGKNMLELMKQSQATNKADEVNIKVSEELHTESSSAKSTPQTKGQGKEQTSNMLPNEKGLREEEEQDSLSKTNQEERAKSPGEQASIEEKQELGGNDKEPQGGQEPEEDQNISDSEDDSDSSDLSGEKQSQETPLKMDEPSATPQEEEEEIVEEDSASGEPSEKEEAMQSKNESSRGEEDIESSSSGEGTGDSEGSDEKGGATVENLKLYQDLQQKLLGGISSMKRFFN